MTISGVQSAMHASAAAATPRADAGGADFAKALKAASPKDKLQRVEGHAYSKVVDGPNKGQYVNEADNARKGKLFSLREGGAHDHHVYGTGPERQVFGVSQSGGAAKPAPAATTPPVKTGATPAPTAATPMPATPAPALTTPSPLLNSPVVSPSPTLPVVPETDEETPDEETPVVTTPPVTDPVTPPATAGVTGTR